MLRNNGEDRPNELTSLAFAFSEDVSDTVSVQDLRLRNETTGQDVDTSGVIVTHSQHITNTVVFDFSALDLAPGFYTVTLLSSGICDAAGNHLIGDPLGVGPSDYEATLLVAPMGDADLSGHVDDDDLSLLLSSWGQDVGWAKGNFNADDIVDDDDLSLLLANWAQEVGPAS